MGRFFLIILLLALPAIRGLSQPPGRVSYQGVLTDASGTPLQGDHSLTFRIYDAPAGGNLLWEETWTVSLTGGLFDLDLGTRAPLAGVPFDRPYWMGIWVDGAELSPRRPLSSVPYSLTAGAVRGSTNIFPSTGNVGVGTLSPQQKLDVAGALRIGETSQGLPGTIRWTGADFQGYDGSSWLSLTSSSGLPPGAPDGLLRYDGSRWRPTTLVTVDTIGGLSIGTAAEGGELRIYTAGSPVPVLETFTGSVGASLYLRDSSGNITCFLGPDTPTGGVLTVYRDPWNLSFEVNSNWASTGEPRVFIKGTSRAACFQMDQQGDQSVLLPPSAVSSEEIADEPGAASAAEGVSYIRLNGSVQTILARSIVVPAPGYVLVLGTGQVEIHHNFGYRSSASFGVSDSPLAFPENQDVALYADSLSPSGIYDFPVTVHGLFTVGSSGTKTFYFLGEQRSYFGAFFVIDMQLSLIYLPTAYGTVSPLAATSASPPDRSAPVGGGMTREEVESQRHQSEQCNRERWEKELAAMRAELDRIRQMISAEKGGSADD